MDHANQGLEISAQPICYSLWRPGPSVNAFAARLTIIPRSLGALEQALSLPQCLASRVNKKLKRQSYTEYLTGPEAQEREVAIGCAVLNQMLELGRPQSYPVR